MKYEVQTYTICQGWINCWQILENCTERPHTFDTVVAAQAELDEFFKDIEGEIAAGEREPDEGYDREDFRIVAVAP